MIKKIGYWIGYWTGKIIGFSEFMIRWVIYLVKNLTRGVTLRKLYGTEKAVTILLNEFIGIKR